VQTSTPAPAAALSLGQWEGLGVGYPGFTITAVPPDPNLAVGPNHIVQWVNNAVVVFDKHGAQVQAPVDDSTFWGAASTCNQLGGFTDPVVQYDRAADRWIVAEVALPLFPGLLGQYAQCFAVSKTSDPTFVSDANGNNTSYYIWTYGFGANVNDYDKIAVWSDGYYVTWNIFQNGANFIGPEACAWSRTDMLAGVSAPRFVCFQLSSAYASLLPSDLDGPAPPPAGSPNFFMAIDPGSGALQLWKFHADFVTKSNSTFTGPTSIPGVAAFTAPCPATQDCIPQPATTQLLDAIGDRLLHRLAYHNFGDHESIVANHTVLTAGGNTGVRWYEVRNPNATPTIYQQRTFAPDSDNRWMASIAMDKTGNIGVGYSVSSAVTFPSVRYTGWEVGNPLGILQAETPLATGFGSQTGYNRWGDYSAMRIDPSDDCTFWYTQEYQATTQSAGWNTRVGSFKFPSCINGANLTATATTVASSGSPSTYGQPVTFAATVAPTSGTGTPTGTVTFLDGAATLGTWTLNNGNANYVTSNLSAGSHSITAVYGGDNSFSGSTSTAITQIVNQAGNPTWYNLSWSNRRTITVNHAKVSGSSSLSNFPMLFSVTDAQLKTVANGGSVGKADGTDILFTASDGATKLNHELESYNPATGQVIAWVQLPSLSPTADTALYIYYGNAAAADQQNKNGTWDSNYLGVWHLPNGTTLTLNDSTASGFNGSNHGATAATGENGGGAGLDGSSAYLSFASAPTIANANFTVSGWSRRTAANRWSMIYTQGTSVGDQGLQLGWNSSNNFMLGFWGDDLISTATYTDSNWHYLVGTFATSNKLQSLYIDGILDRTRTANGNYGGSGQADMGTFTEVAGYFYPGSLDEVRVSNTVRSTAWIATEYTNQNSPSTFFSLGSQQ
jgi:hypothetical protein